MNLQSTIKRPWPGERQPELERDRPIPADMVIVSADNHFSLCEDIFVERFPDHLKDRAPRVWREGPVWHMGVGGQSFLPPNFVPVCAVNDVVEGGHEMDARAAELKLEGIDKELVFPNLVIALLNYPDIEVRQAGCSAYNQYLAELQQRYAGAFYGVGLFDQTSPEKAGYFIDEIKDLGLKTYMLPLAAGVLPGGKPISYAMEEMEPLWEAAEAAGLPVCFHIGEAVNSSGRGAAGTRLMANFAPFRNVVGQLVFGGILDRHPSLRIVFAEGGINWLPAALQDAEWIAASCAGLDWELRRPVADYWRDNFYSCFMHDPLGLKLIDEIGAERAMWSIDYPHAEGIFGSSRSSIAQVIDTVGADKARLILGGNAVRVFGLD